MPGFESVMSPADRWDVINFIRARAAGILSRGVGPVVSAAAAPAVPDFAFQNGDRQQTLSRILQDGPALVALFSRPPASGRVAQLAAAQKRLPATGLEDTGDRSGFRIGGTGGDRRVPAIGRGCGRCRCDTGVVSGAG